MCQVSALKLKYKYLVFIATAGLVHDCQRKQNRALLVLSIVISPTDTWELLERKL